MEQTWGTVLSPPGQAGAAAGRPQVRTIADLDAEIARRRAEARRGKERLSGGSGVGAGGLPQQPTAFSPPLQMQQQQQMPAHMLVAPSPTSTHDLLRVSQLEAQLRDEQQRGASMQQRVAYLERENELQKASLQRLAAEKGEASGRLEVLEEESEDLQNDLLLARQQLQTVSAKLRNVEADNLTFKEQNNTLRIRLQEQASAGGGAGGGGAGAGGGEAAAASNPSSAEQEEYIATLQSHYQQLEQYYAALQAQLHEAVVQKEDAEQAHAEGQEALAVLGREASEREQLCEQLRARVMELEEAAEEQANRAAAAAPAPAPVSAFAPASASQAPAPAPAPSAAANMQSPAPKTKPRDPYDDPDFDPRIRSPAPAPAPVQAQAQAQAQAQESEGLRRRPGRGDGPEGSSSSSSSNSNNSNGHGAANGSKSAPSSSRPGNRSQPLPAAVRILWLLVLIAFKSAFLGAALLLILVALDLDSLALAALPPVLRLPALVSAVDTARAAHGAAAALVGGGGGGGGGGVAPAAWALPSLSLGGTDGLGSGLAEWAKSLPAALSWSWKSLLDAILSPER